MKVFIDAGANDSCSARIFRKVNDPANEYKIYSFEIDPLFLNNFSAIPNLVFINKAVWVQDGEMEFYRSYARRHDGGTLLKSKTSGILDKENPIKVETIDFSKWLLSNFNEADSIILKMDIEGAEYEVIEHMIDTGAFGLIDELWIEWHYGKVGIPKERHDKLVSKIEIPTQKWAGLEQAIEILGKDYLNKPLG